MAAGLTQGTGVTYSLSLPGVATPVEGQGFVARLVPQGRVNFVGLQFKVRGGSSDSTVIADVARYVNAYLSDRLNWSA